MIIANILEFTLSFSSSFFVTAPYLEPAHNLFWSHWEIRFGFRSHFVFYELQTSTGRSPI